MIRLLSNPRHPRADSQPLRSSGPAPSLRDALDRFAARLAALGARRKWRGSAWYWDLKPDYRPGEVFEL